MKVTRLQEAVCECGQVYLRHPRSRINLCCRCRPKKTDKPVSTLPSGPLADNAITSEEALTAYLDHDELLCLVCGTRHKGLYAHLRTAHGLKAREYKLRYGIPITTGLVGKATKEKMQRAALATVKKMEATEFANLKTARSRKGESRVAWTPYQRHAQAEKMLGSKNHPSRHEGVDILYCKTCGGEVYTDARTSLVLQCRILCDTCRGKGTSGH